MSIRDVLKLHKTGLTNYLFGLPRQKNIGKRKPNLNGRST
ncbi:hypothetical protein LPICM17_650012 [Lactococcus piscium]|nr:hypothetical protein LPICM17_650012 [Lactococcus piscium]